MTTATGVLVTLPRDGEKRQWDVSQFRDEDKVPTPKYRHAAPSAPWPWMDFSVDDADVLPLSPGARDTWTYYPKSHFANWTRDQVERCRMLTICKDHYMCRIHKVDVFKDGTFDKLDEQARTRQIPSIDAAANEFWDEIQHPLDSKFRIRALFVDSISKNVLQILGARYNIEPFFFASSANWIPSRYQEDPKPGEGDHITVVLPFVRPVINQQERVSPTPSNGIQYLEKGPAPITDNDQTIDTQVPLVLSTGKVLLQDLLAIHMVRSREENIIISYHHHSQLQKTTAKLLRSLVQRTSDSVYWQKLYKKSQDPTFVFLAILWYALYAWDEALEVLYAHLSVKLEATKTNATTGIQYTRELHQLQAHLYYYQQLLRDFSQSVKFVRDTHNPVMCHESISKAERELSQSLLELESETLLSEIERLETQRQAQSDRLQNAMHLAFSTINIQDSRSMHKLTTATMRDSAAMKQISHLTMIFLPASYIASVFGMNVVEINPGSLETFNAYVVSTVILTTITAWLGIALQEHSSLHQDQYGELRRGIAQRIAWPWFNICILMQKLFTAARARGRQQEVDTWVVGPV